MRVIKYRGLGSSGWVYGTPLFNKLGAFIVTEENPHICDQHGYIEIDEFMNVKPETVGEFTGKHDKAGKEIYEGHIVKKDVAVMEKDSPIYKNYEVRFEDGAFRYGAGRPIDKYVEIIGNIHENPELLNEK